MPFSESLATYGHIWALQTVVLIVLLIAIVSCWKRLMKFVASHMIQIALVIWSVGVVIYMLGFSYEGTAHSFPALIFRSMQAALGMFLSENELIEVSEHFKESPLYMTIFAVTHFSALFLSAILVFNTIGYRLRSSFQLMVESIRCKRQRKDTFVFMGVNSPSMSLARDIRKSNRDARIIFLHQSKEHSMGEKLEVTQLIDSATMNNHGTSVEGLVDSIDSAMLLYVSSESARRDKNKYARLRHILESSSTLYLHFFTDDEDQNIALAELFINGLKLDFEKVKTVKYYILAGESAKRHSVEELIALKGDDKGKIKTIFVDRTRLAVASLMHDAYTHPVTTYPESAIKGGRVEGDFYAWQLGLGSTGKEMFRFFYEFSSFIGADDKPIRKNITIFDRNLEKMKGQMFRSCPAVMESGCVEGLNIEIGTLEFWHRLREAANKLNCICVALGDDEKDLNCTRDIYRHLLQYRTSPSVMTRIYVRVYSTQYESLMKALAKEYNSSGSGIEIVPFGGVSDVFNTKIILKSDVLDAFKQFNYWFDMIRGRNQGKNAEECWISDFSISKYRERYLDPVVSLDELHRRKEQCASQTYYIGTLLVLAGVKRGDKERVLALAEVTKQRPVDHLGYDYADPQTADLLDVLVRTSYLKQTALHDCLGYRPSDEETIRNDRNKSMRQKLTQYSVPWDESSDKTKRVSYAVLDTSFTLATNIVNKHLK
ncbi:MAG: hypothetical protein KBT05_07115 [Bacteroidales bacterium]|nr:hypothetical protein [Candidatus Cryptobacteroides caccocaballi]